MSNRSITQLTFTCSKSTISTLEDGVLEDVQSSGVLIVNFEHMPHLFLVFLLQTLNKEMLAGKL